MRVLELRADLDLAAEALVVHPRRELGREDLHHDLPLQRHVGGDEDARHPAAAQLAFELVLRGQGLLEDVGADGERAVAAEAERLASWLGDVRVTPRFRTPLERELAA